MPRAAHAGPGRRLRAAALQASVLNAFFDAVSIVLHDMVEREPLFSELGAVMLILDELVDGGIIMETDPMVLAQCGEMPSGKKVRHTALRHGPRRPLTAPPGRVTCPSPRSRTQTRRSTCWGRTSSGSC